MKMKILTPLQISFLMSCLFLSFSTGYGQSVADAKPASSPDWLTNPGLYLAIGGLVILMVVAVALAKITVNLSKVNSKLKKGLFLAVFFILSGSTVFSQVQVTETVAANKPPEWLYNPNFYPLVFLFVIIMATILVLYSVNMQLIRSLSPKNLETETEKSIQTVVEKEPSVLRKIYLRLVDSVPVSEEKDIMLDHDYDGIKELDNNLPPWWKYGFYVTIIFGFFYLLHYHVFLTGNLQAEEYKEELVIARQQKEDRMRASAENVNEENVVALSQPELILKGRETFQKLCAACHKTDGGGQVGPNLTDEFWLHGGGIKNIFKTITYGVPNKGMISWQSQLAPKQIQQVASYILTLNGTNPPGAKEPQGDKWTEEINPVTDSSKTINLPADSTAVALADTSVK